MVSTIALLNAERQKNAVLRKNLNRVGEKLNDCVLAFTNYRRRTGEQITELANENKKLKDALQEAFRYERGQYSASKKAQEKNLEKAGLKAT